MNGRPGPYDQLGSKYLMTFHWMDVDIWLDILPFNPFHMDARVDRR